MKITNPLPDATFTISSGAAWPSMTFETDAAGPHTWSWKIAWKTFTESGNVSTPSNAWDGQPALSHLGGVLTVGVKTADGTATTTVHLRGTNPSADEAKQFLSTQANSDGFDKILQQETHFQHFDSKGEPIKSFDNGYGMCQLTNPTPNFGQVWNWQRNVQAGLALFAAKRNAAIAYLRQGGRTATDDQVRYEAVCRWNGGPYHVWDAKAGWVRNPNILCDPATGNIGWDMTEEANKGKSVADLHKRDGGSYAHPPGPGAHWTYSGVCYADKVLG